jgi:hypothetical protein
LDKGKNGTAEEICSSSGSERGGAEDCCEEMMENLPNKSMRPSAASRNEIVSTPSAVTGTFANDCCD